MRSINIIISLLIFTIVITSCKPKETSSPAPPAPTKSQVKEEVAAVEKVIPLDYDTTYWEELTENDGIVNDIRYATDNNFTKKKIYPCPRCFLRPVLAKKMKMLQKDINAKYGMKLKFFDCYRPRPAQQLLWDIVPDARYVTPPKKGSMHNKGLAVDVTLIDKDGNELDMGTPYDFFGKEAYPGNMEMPKHVIKNRKILLKMMEAHGLSGIRTEWWHFSLKSESAPLDDWEWEC